MLSRFGESRIQSGRENPASADDLEKENSKSLKMEESDQGTLERKITKSCENR